ncbi:hypothetical protein DQ226_13800 [Dietzia maris]|uniref:Uncharacterized protein n=1 Tax=Dietzia maris TaxID=37915 RepID=A0A365P7V1_9ACTN|nr:hypothetical protein DQ226_13800 [Dietzia maris]
MALLLGLFFLVPLGLERSAAVVPTTSADPVPQTPGPQTWVLSSTVADPGPNAGDSMAERDPKRPRHRRRQGRRRRRRRFGVRDHPGPHRRPDP